MLQNPNWDKPQPKPATWASLIAWLETKDPEETFVYKNASCCLAAQYNRSIGRHYSVTKALSSNPLTYLSFDRRLERLAAKVSNSRFRLGTFGDALEMARKR